MDEYKTDDPYEPGHVDDPVTKDAVAVAMAATERQAQRRWYERAFTWFVIVVLALGTAGAVVSAINAVEIHNQNNSLRATQECLIKLDSELQAEQAVRTQIAADDRRAVDNLVAAIATAKSPKQVQQALQSYQATRKRNDSRRAKYVTRIPDVNECKLVEASVQPSLTAPSTPAALPATPTPTKKSAKPSAKSTPHPSPTPGTGVRTVTNVVHAPQPGKTYYVTVVRTRTVTKTAPPIRIPVPVTVPAPIPKPTNPLCTVVSVLCGPILN